MSKAIPTTGATEKVEFRQVTQIEITRSPDTTGGVPVVRTVPTQILEGHISLRYAPIQSKVAGANTKTGE